MASEITSNEFIHAFLIALNDLNYQVIADTYDAQPFSKQIIVFDPPMNIMDPDPDEINDTEIEKIFSPMACGILNAAPHLKWDQLILRKDEMGYELWIKSGEYSYNLYYALVEQTQDMIPTIDGYIDTEYFSIHERVYNNSFTEAFPQIERKLKTKLQEYQDN